MKNTIKYILSCILLILCTNIWAGDEIYISSLKGTNISVGNWIVGEDDLYTYMQQNSTWENRAPNISKTVGFDKTKRFTNAQADAYISLRWEGSEGIVFPQEWKYQVKLRVTAWDASGYMFTQTERSLTIDYDPAHQTTFKDWDVLRIPEAHKVLVSVVEINYSENNSAYLSEASVRPDFKDLYIETNIEVERYYSLDVSQLLTLNQQNLDITDRTTTYSWNHIEGAEQYDFEWLFVSSELNSAYNPSDLKDWDNASRVTLNDNRYSLELPYEEGIIYFRVRAIGYANPCKQPITTDWTEGTSITVANNGGNITPFEGDKNWTYQAQYAEQGKRSETLSFFDGVGHGHQTIVKDNDNNEAIVAETGLDKYGRNAINIAPSPANNHQLKFYENYNLQSGSPINMGLAETGGQTLDNISGSSKYYSNQTANLANQKGAYIPDAEGYPYTHTIFDAQGRPKIQTGVGETHSLGNDHETKYLYGGVYQEELDRLFGAEIGYAEHYRMQAVKDPNGQVSVSYENLSGQPIATAIVGETPTDPTTGTPILDALDASGYNYPSSRTETVDFTKFNRLERNDLGPSWVIRREFTPISTGAYLFEYEVNIGDYGNCLNPNGSCEYELSILLYDDEGNLIPLIDNNSANITTPFTVNDGDEIDFTINVETGTTNQVDIGNYWIEKRLRLKGVAETIEGYRQTLQDDYIAYLLWLEAGRIPPAPPFNCINPDDYLVAIDISGCVEESTVTSNDIPTSEDYCAILEEKILDDFQPGGQYFENTPDPSNPNYVLAYYDVGGLTTEQQWANFKLSNNIENSMFIFQAYHPEYCHYQARCRDIPPGDTKTWYQKSYDYNIELMNSPVFSGSLDPVGQTYCSGTTNFPLLVTETYLPTSISTAINTKICSYIPNPDLSNGLGAFLSIFDVTLFQFYPNYPTTPTPSSITWTSLTATEQESYWRTIRSLYIDIKERAIDDYFASTNTNCPFLVDAITTDHAIKDGLGMDIHVPHYGTTVDNVSNQTGISSSTQTPPIDPNWVNQVVQDYSLCGHKEAVVHISCEELEDLELFLFDVNANPQTIFLGDVWEPTSLYTTNDCSDQISDIESEINTALAAYTDITGVVELEDINNDGIPEIAIRIRVAGVYNPTTHQLDYNTTYDNYELRLKETTGAVIETSNFGEKPCEQAYAICLCEEIDALKQSSPSLTNADIAHKFNTDLGLPPNTLLGSDISYIVNSYCSDISDGLYKYPPEGVEAYLALTTAIIADPVIPEVLKECITTNPQPLSCEDEVIALANFYTEQLLAEAIIAELERIEADLVTQCVGSNPFGPDVLTMTYDNKTIHYTLYYYDAAGNLERTVPPTGVTMLINSSELLDAQADRNSSSSSPIKPAHRMITTYEYNSLNEVVSSEAPDRGIVDTYYDRLGRPIFTQDAQQKVDGEATYSVYDELGRIIETGLVKDVSTNFINSFLSSPTFFDNLDNGLFPNSYVSSGDLEKREVRQSYYNEGLADMDAKFSERPSNLRNRVAAQTYSFNGQDLTYKSAYTYDIFGNAKEVIQYNALLTGNPYKKMAYDYDLISGVVNEVYYQPEKNDQISYKYTYDANNRLIKARSSLNRFIWITDATYEYYLHGPLQRMEIGDKKVQGLDYIYTLQGWVKSVNSITLKDDIDPGRDANKNSTIHTLNDLHANVAKDVFGYGVHYFKDDYTRTNVTFALPAFIAPNTNTDLFNGNIGSVTQALTKPKLGAAPQAPLDVIWKKYRYDQLHRIKMAETFEKNIVNLGSNGWISPTTPFQNNYKTTYKYGPNGNILNLQRYDDLGTEIDNLNYYYESINSTTDDDPRNFSSNQLSNIKDNVGSAIADYDIDSQNDGNYEYNENGSLRVDESADIGKIEWTLDGKVHTVSRTGGSNKGNIEYFYDFQGNRIAKIFKPSDSNAKWEYTIYSRDPQGNTIGIYNYDKKGGTTPIHVIDKPAVHLTEQMLYGSSRLGIIKRNVQVAGPARILGNGKFPVKIGQELTTGFQIEGFWNKQEHSSDLSYTDYNKDRDGDISTEHVVDLHPLQLTAIDEIKYKLFRPKEEVPLVRLDRQRGWHRYELKNFRDDIRQIITDIKIRKDDNSDNIADHYEADVLQVTDNYSFGWDMPNRNFSLDLHRYSFNGKETDKEWGGSGIQDYGFRLYNPAIAKFLSVDPLAPDYPELTTYQFASNSPIANIDLDGLESFYAVDGKYLGKYGTSTEIRVINENFYRETNWAFWGVIGMTEANKTPFLNKQFKQKIETLIGSSNEVFPSENQAALDFAFKNNGNTHHYKKEYGTSIYGHEFRNDDGTTFKGYILGETVTGEEVENGHAIDPYLAQAPKGFYEAGWEKVSMIHTHPQGGTTSEQENFSCVDCDQFRVTSRWTSGDIPYSHQFQLPFYLVTPKGKVKLYDYKTSTTSEIYDKAPSFRGYPKNWQYKPGDVYRASLGTKKNGKKGIPRHKTPKIDTFDHQKKG